MPFAIACLTFCYSIFDKIYPLKSQQPIAIKLEILN